jgi:O-antigen ligase
LHSALPSFVERHKSHLLLATTLWTGSGVIIYLLAPLALPAILVLAVGAPVAWYVAAQRSLPLQRPSTVSLALVLAGFYLAVNASWSLRPGDAQISLAMFCLLVVVVHFVGNGLTGSDTDALRAMALGLAIGLIVGGAVLCVDTFSLQWARRMLMSFVPPLRPKAVDMRVEEGWVTWLLPFLLNRSTAALTLLLWPTLHAIALVGQRAPLRYWLLAALIPAVAAILGSEHATSKLAFTGAAVTFVLASLSLKGARRLITVGWLAVLVLVVPVATLAYQGQLYLVSSLPYSARARIVIWGHTSELIAKAPILGSGINTARALHHPHDAPFAPGSTIPVTTNLHSHNVYLQTWYETGLVGAVFLLAIGLLVLREIARAPEGVQPYLYATFVTCALMGGTSFSLWQPWFMGSFGLAAGFALVGRALAERSQLPATA